MPKSCGILYLLTDYISKITCSILTHLDREPSCLDSFPAGIIHQPITQNQQQVLMHSRLL